MPKNKIAFDLDGVLADCLHPFDFYVNEMFGIKRPKEKQVDFNLGNTLPMITRDEINAALAVAFKDYDRFPIYPGATEILAKLYKLTGEPPFILTARPHSAATDTYALVKLIAKKTPFHLTLMHPNTIKRQYLHGYHYFVEDRRKTALDLSSNGIMVPLVRKTYNKIADFRDLAVR